MQLPSPNKYVLAKEKGGYGDTEFSGFSIKGLFGYFFAQLLENKFNVLVAVLLVVVGHCYHHVPTVNQRLLLQLLSS